jgi:hypothetical protein
MPALQTASMRSPSKRGLPRIAALVPFLPQATCRWLCWTGSSSRCRTSAIGRPICRRNRAGAMVVNDQSRYTLNRHVSGMRAGHGAERPDWLAEAGGFEPLHFRIGLAKTLSPGRQDSNLRISIEVCRAAPHSRRKFQAMIDGSGSDSEMQRFAVRVQTYGIGSARPGSSKARGEIARIRSGTCKQSGRIPVFGPDVTGNATQDKEVGQNVDHIRDPHALNQSQCDCTRRRFSNAPSYWPRLRAAQRSPPPASIICIDTRAFVRTRKT